MSYNHNQDWQLCLSLDSLIKKQVPHSVFALCTCDDCWSRVWACSPVDESRAGQATLERLCPVSQGGTAYSHQLAASKQEVHFSSWRWPDDVHWVHVMQNWWKIFPLPALVLLYTVHRYHDSKNLCCPKSKNVCAFLFFLRAQLSGFLSEMQLALVGHNNENVRIACWETAEVRRAVVGSSTAVR